MTRPRTWALAAGALAVLLLMAGVGIVAARQRGAADPDVATRSQPTSAPATTAAPPAADDEPSTIGTSAPGPAPEAAPSTAPGATPSGRPLSGRTVAVDPGHNGGNATAPAQINRQVDAGGFRKACNSTGTATASGVSESAVNWAIAGRVEARLRDLGATVVLTRHDDRGIGPCVDERAAVANRARADVLLSIHADGAPATASGFHVIRPGLVKGYTEDIVGPSSVLAVAVRDALVAGGLHVSTYAGQDGLVTRTDLGTLDRSDVPACMVELGNLRNPTEAAALTSSAGQDRAAGALVAGLVAWLGRSPAERTGPPPPPPSPAGTAKE